MNDQLKTFIYILGRDYLPLGSIEEIMKNHIEPINNKFKEISYSNKYLEQYASDISNRLNDK